MRALILAIAIVASLPVLPGAALHAAPGDREDKLERKRQKVMERIRSLRAWKLTEALELDEATAGKLFPILSRYDAKLDELAKARHALMREMRAVIEAATGEAATGEAATGGSDAKQSAQMNALIDKLMVEQRKMWALQEERLREVRKVLSPVQTAKIMILLPEIDRKIQQQLRRVMGKPGKHKLDKDRDAPPLEP